VRRLLALLVVVALLAVVADRVALHLAERAVADQARVSAGLTATPRVTVHGFPFLTQAVRGKYDRIDVAATGLQRQGVRVARLDATLLGAQVPLGDALHGSVTSIPVAGLTASAVVTYADLAARSGLAGVTITPQGDLVRVTGRVTVLGRTVRATALSRVALRGTRIAVTASSLQVLGESTPRLVDLLAGALDLLVPVGRLPYDLRLTGLRVTPGGIRLAARSGPTVLRAD
jgi:hypothetical protein